MRFARQPFPALPCPWRQHCCWQIEPIPSIRSRGHRSPRVPGQCPMCIFLGRIWRRARRATSSSRRTGSGGVGRRAGWGRTATSVRHSSYAKSGSYDRVPPSWGMVPPSPRKLGVAWPAAVHGARVAEIRRPQGTPFRHGGPDAFALLASLNEVSQSGQSSPWQATAVVRATSALPPYQSWMRRRSEGNVWWCCDHRSRSSRPLTRISGLQPWHRRFGLALGSVYEGGFRMLR